MQKEHACHCKIQEPLEYLKVNSESVIQNDLHSYFSQRKPFCTYYIIIFLNLQEGGVAVVPRHPSAKTIKTESPVLNNIHVQYWIPLDSIRKIIFNLVICANG